MDNKNSFRPQTPDAFFSRNEEAGSETRAAASAAAASCISSRVGDIIGQPSSFPFLDGREGEDGGNSNLAPNLSFQQKRRMHFGEQNGLWKKWFSI